ncbi:hypothetical protein PanWU01x14_272760 [Parasponia andersonii]|uniref:Uncharacterized protein n=1 Tax=Parasponia andersonii TaxID=3476 RepID=A0A2P5B477_PARAD|nr:hypothetical protein PanWU01x14_272760 [Parasponia andersonii]
MGRRSKGRINADPYRKTSASSAYNAGRKQGKYFSLINFSDNEANTAKMEDKVTDVVDDKTSR